MTISMFQCLLIGLWTAFCLAGMLFGIYTNRCLVMAAGVIPTHICPTTALYPEILVAKDGQVADRWQVTARNRRITY